MHCIYDSFKTAPLTHAQGLSNEYILFDANVLHDCHLSNRIEELKAPYEVLVLYQNVFKVILIFEILLFVCFR